MGQNGTTKELEYIESIRRFQTSDPAHADLFNKMLDDLVNNDNFIKNMAEQLQMRLGGFSIYPEELTQAQYNALASDIKNTPKMIFIIRKDQEEEGVSNAD